MLHPLCETAHFVNWKLFDTNFANAFKVTHGVRLKGLCKRFYHSVTYSYQMVSCLINVML